MAETIRDVLKRLATSVELHGTDTYQVNHALAEIEALIEQANINPDEFMPPYDKDKDSYQFGVKIGAMECQTNLKELLK